MSAPETIFLLDQIRDGVRSMDDQREDSTDQIPALRQIVRAATEALAQLETRKDTYILDLLSNTPGLEGYAWEYQRSQQIEERS